MARGAEQKLYNNFIRGLITETTKINFPEDAAVTASNFDFNRDGSISRRRGIDREGGSASNVATSFTVGTDAVSTYNWNSVEGDAALDFVVMQFGQYLQYYLNGSQVSGGKYLFTTNLADHKVSSATTANLEQNEVDMVAGNGRLYVVHPYCEPFYVKYINNSATITGATQANPCVVTATAHGFANGDQIYIADVVGMTELNGNLYTLANVAANTFELLGIDSSAYTAYSSGGTAYGGILETSIIIQVRDLEGVDDSLAVDEKPTTLTDSHQYNLNNQGWEDRSSELGAVFTGRGSYPSNAESWQQGKYAHPTSGYEVFNYTQFEKQSYGNAAAPKGHFIYDAFNKSVAVTTNDTRTSTTFNYDGSNLLTITFGAVHPFSVSDTIYFTPGMIYKWNNGGGCPGNSYAFGASYTVNTVPSTTTITIAIGALASWTTDCTGTHGDIWKILSSTETDPIDQRPSVNAFFAGRAWYAGVGVAPYSNKIYFSQILEGDGNAGYCYQSGDPTSEFENELIATDGGIIPIPDLDTVLRMEVIGTSILVFAKNGVWQISGSEGGFFTANSISVNKVTNSGMLSKKSYVEAEGIPYYWSKDGIFKLVQDPISGKISVENISIDTIQTLYNNIDITYRAESIGIYNDITKKVYWLYAPDSGVKDNILIFDTVTNAFYPYVLDDGEQVLDMFIASSYTDPELRIKFVTNIIASGLITVSDFNELDHHDWEQHYGTGSGVDAAGYVETNHENLAKPEKKTKQITYVTMYFTRTEDNWIDVAGDILLDNQSSCMLRGKWDWADSNAGGKWTTQRQAYRFTRNYVAPAAPYPSAFDNGSPLTVTKNKIRGKGRSVRLRMDTEAGKHCTIEGWSVDYTAGTAT